MSILNQKISEYHRLVPECMSYSASANIHHAMQKKQKFVGRIFDNMQLHMIISSRRPMAWDPQRFQFERKRIQFTNRRIPTSNNSNSSYELIMFCVKCCAKKSRQQVTSRTMLSSVNTEWICHEMKINLSYFRTNFNEFWHGSLRCSCFVSLMPAKREIEKKTTLKNEKSKYAYFQEVAHTQHRPLHRQFVKAYSCIWYRPRLTYVTSKIKIVKMRNA